MHCPRCGQQQTSDKIHFCTRCGFALNDVKELLVSELHEIKEEKRNKIGKTVGQGLAFILFGLVLISVLAILRDLSFVPQVFVKIAALIFCVGGLVRMCYPFIYGGGVLHEKTHASLQYDAATNTLTGANVADNSLPQAQSNPFITFEARSFGTAEIVQPPSVTEHTTKLLKTELEQK